MSTPSLTLRRLREARHMGMRELGEAAHVSISLISRLENGSLEETNFGAVVRLCDALGISVDQLLHSTIETCPQCEGRGWVEGK